jgi:hypothetical protein
MTTTLIIYFWIHLSMLKNFLGEVGMFAIPAIIWAIVVDIIILVWLIKKVVRG